MYSEEVIEDLNLLAARQYQIQDELERQILINQEIKSESIQQIQHLREVILDMNGF